MELKSNVIQIQQYLSDISATRGMQGYNNGLPLAEKYYKAAKQNLTDLRSSSTDSVTTEKLNKLDGTLDDFYNVGKNMASVYIKSGPEQGNRYMAKFDPYATAMEKELGDLVDQHKAETKDFIDSIQTRETRGIYLSTIVSCVSVALSLFLAFIITGAAIKPLKLFSEKFQQGSTGDLRVHIDYDKDNEIGELTKEFNVFISRLHRMVEDIANSSGRINQQSSDLSAASEQFSSTFAEQSSQINSIASAVEEMVTTAQDIMNRLENMTSTIKDTAKVNRHEVRIRQSCRDKG